MKKKIFIWVIVVFIVIILLFIVGKKVGWFGKSGNFKEVEVLKIVFIDIMEMVVVIGKI